jgi:hypothetical protein
VPKFLAPNSKFEFGATFLKSQTERYIDVFASIRGHLSAFDEAICDARWKISSPYLAHSYHGSTINMYVLLL